MPPATRTSPDGSPDLGPPHLRLPPADRSLQQRALAGLLVAFLSLAGLLAMSNLSRGVYVLTYALAAGAMALWLAVTSIRRARLSRTARPRWSVAATVIASVGILLSGFGLVGFLVFGKQLAAYSHCLQGANTIAAQQVCQSQFTHSMTHQVNGLGG